MNCFLQLFSLINPLNSPGFSAANQQLGPFATWSALGPGRRDGKHVEWFRFQHCFFAHLDWFWFKTCICMCIYIYMHICINLHLHMPVSAIYIYILLEWFVHGIYLFEWHIDIARNVSTCHSIWFTLMSCQDKDCKVSLNEPWLGARGDGWAIQVSILQLFLWWMMCRYRKNVCFVTNFADTHVIDTFDVCEMHDGLTDCIAWIIKRMTHLFLLVSSRSRR